MHGLIMVQFQNFVADAMGPDAWETLLIRAGVPGRRFTLEETYPDEVLVRLVTAAQEMTKTPVHALLERFGEYIVPGLAKLYHAQLRPEWSALDVIQHTDQAIHSVVRRQNPGAAPPPLRASRTAPNEVRVSYTSARRMCAVARGICRGLGKHYRETLEIEELSCMLRGDRTCEIVIRRIE